MQCIVGDYSYNELYLVPCASLIICLSFWYLQVIFASAYHYSNILRRVYTHIYVYAHTHICVYTHTHICVYTHTYMCIYTHIYVYTHRSLSKYQKPLVCNNAKDIICNTCHRHTPTHLHSCFDKQARIVLKRDPLCSTGIVLCAVPQ